MKNYLLIIIFSIIVVSCTTNKLAPVTKITTTKYISKQKTSVVKIKTMKNVTARHHRKIAKPFPVAQTNRSLNTSSKTQRSLYIPPKQQAITKVQQGESTSIVQSQSKPSKTDTIVSPKSTLKWVWPTTGPLLGKFSLENQCHGIDIGGIEGTKITAAYGGIVMYSGSGLRGYGNLIIIKHEKNFLTAYAHNRKNIVKEGDIVQVGQQIAEMGASDTNRVKLHFQIRKNGQPVDPLSMLPTRKH